MYTRLFDLAGIAILHWVLLIFLPTWRVTRRIAASALFPAYLAALYVVGIVPLLLAAGPGIIRDFGSAEGVVRLLGSPEVALIAWIHILAFDQVVGLLIYRENMERRYVPVPVQSVLLFLTLMFGPVGFLAYYLLRAARRGTLVPADDIVAEPAAATPARGGAYAGMLRSALRPVGATLAGQRSLVAVALLGFALAAVCLGVMAVNGRTIPPEGDLLKPLTFDLAMGIYVLTLAFYLPFAGFSTRGARRWRGATVALVCAGLTIENVQIFRGLDPRFSRYATPADQLIGLGFFLIANGLIVLFLVLAYRLVRRRTAGADGPVLLAVRYAAAATVLAFAAGMWMSFNGGPRVGAASILPLHAVGFHGLQAVPLVALALAWAGVPAGVARGRVHVAGAAWLGACAAVGWQTAAGRPLLEPSPASLLAAAMLVGWATVAAQALWAWRRAEAPPAAAGARVALG